MGDKKQRKPQILFEFRKKIDHLSLHGNVEGGDGLVADDEPGLEDHCPGDADALALTPGELVGIASRMLRPEAHGF